MASTLASNSNGVVFASTDEGNSWFGAALGSASIEFIYTNDNETACATPGGLLLSGNCGSNWSPATNGPGLRVVGISGLRRFGVNSTGDALVSISNGSWNMVYDNSCSNIGTAIISNANGVFYTTNGCGFFASSDSAATFQVENSGLGSWNLFDVALCGPYLFVCGGGGVQRRLLSQVFTSVPDNSIASDGLIVAPNPFENELQYSLPANSGQIRRVLLMSSDGRVQYDVRTNSPDDLPIDLPVGVYFLSVFTSQRVFVERVVRE